MKIKKIEKLDYSGMVYNIGTTPNHNYFVNRILVHNCYKSNTGEGNNMSFDTFKTMFDKFPNHLTQIALGIGDIDGNPDLWKIMEYCRANDVVPNITINGFRYTESDISRLASLCGAVSVSNYNSKNCYDTISDLRDAGLTQINIHQLMAEETIGQCKQVLMDARAGRIRGLNAIVFLWLKPKGRAVGSFTQVQDPEKYKVLIEYAMEYDIPIGFDSCGAGKFAAAIRGRADYDKLAPMIESCESTLFSGYIDCRAKFFPCSFAEGTKGWETGLDILECADFVKDIWNNDRVVEFRNKTIASKDCNGCRQCQVYDLGFGK